MASKGLQGFSRSLSVLRTATSHSRDPLMQCLAPRFTRAMATEARLPSNLDYSTDLIQSNVDAYEPPTVLTTIYKFPSMEPLRFEAYKAKHLYLPMRRDLLHRAVVFEGDGERQGTGSTKTRWEIHGSHRKIRPQKGTGRARLGSKQAPHLMGGAKAHGPKPRDFATLLPRKMYDLAWRTALSMRYRKGELIICEGGRVDEDGVALGMDIQHRETRFAKTVFEHNHWGHADGRTLVITSGVRENLMSAVLGMPEDGEAMSVEDVDVKNLLELGRIVIEKTALDVMLLAHQSDLGSKFRTAV